MILLPPTRAGLNVINVLLQVCEEQMCEEQILPLAVNFMDRFLCVCKIKRQHLQLLGATCLLIASKLRSTNFLPIDLLCAYTDYSVTYDLVVVSYHFFFKLSKGEDVLLYL